MALPLIKQIGSTDRADAFSLLQQTDHAGLEPRRLTWQMKTFPLRYLLAPSRICHLLLHNKYQSEVWYKNFPWCQWQLLLCLNMDNSGRGREKALCLASLSVKWAVQVRAQLDPFVSERWNSTNMLLTCLHQCRQLIHQRPYMCYYVYVIMHVRDR